MFYILLTTFLIFSVQGGLLEYVQPHQYHSISVMKQERSLGEGINNLSLQLGEDYTFHMEAVKSPLLPTTRSVVMTKSGPEESQLGEEEVYHCHYRGKVNNEENSKAVLSYCGGKLNGYFQIDGEIYHVIHTRDMTKPLVISAEEYDQAHRMMQRKRGVEEVGAVARCGADDNTKKNTSSSLHNNNNNTKKKNTSSSLHNKQMNRSFERQLNDIQKKVTSCPSGTIQKVPLIIVNDYEFYHLHGNGVEAASAALVAQANEYLNDQVIYDACFELYIMAQITWKVKTSDIDYDLDHSLLNNSFEAVMEDNLEDEIDNVIGDHRIHVLIHLYEETDSIGNAGIGTVCSSHSGDVTLELSGRDNWIGPAALLLHEIGHSFGAWHDETQGYLMYPSINMSNPNTDFSTTSSNWFDTYFDDEGGLCFPTTEQPKTGEWCGNGWVEQGEECDVGLGGDGCCSSDCQLTCKYNVRASWRNSVSQITGGRAAVLKTKWVNKMTGALTFEAVTPKFELCFYRLTVKWVKLGGTRITSHCVQKGNNKFCSQGKRYICEPNWSGFAPAGIPNKAAGGNNVRLDVKVRAKSNHVGRQANFKIRWTAMPFNRRAKKKLSRNINIV